MGRMRDLNTQALRETLRPKPDGGLFRGGADAQESQGERESASGGPKALTELSKARSGVILLVGVGW